MVTKILLGLVAALHVYFMVLEMFLWTTPKGRKVFGLKEDFALQSKSLAMNQGLYNGFLAAGLLWSLWLAENGFDNAVFFLSCVIAAGIFGALTVNKKIFFVQALPALLALSALYFNV